MGRIAQIENELRELAGLISDEGVAREAIRARLHGVADRVRLQESPYLTLSAAARRYGIAVKDFRNLVELGEVKTVEIAGRRRVDIRQFGFE
jgi:hypothetical protein